jgi:hypothetical protein
MKAFITFGKILLCTSYGFLRLPAQAKARTQGWTALTRSPSATDQGVPLLIVIIIVLVLVIGVALVEPR